MANESPRIITESTLEIVERETDACRVSVLRRVVGLPVRGRVGQRIDRALAAHGIIPPATPTEQVSRG
jgi:hypothetical protein